MITVHERITVPAAPTTVWGVVSDPRAVVECVGGATLGDQQTDGSFDAGVRVKFGPVSVTFRARVTLELDDATMVGHVTARGRDTQGGTRVTSTMTFHVADEGGGSSAVAIDGEVDIAGRLAGLIEGGASIVVSRMSREFADNLARRCAAGAASATGREQRETETT